MTQIDRDPGMAESDTETKAAGFFSPEQGRDLASKGYELLIRASTKAGQIVFALFVVSGVICGSGLVLGILALSGTTQTLWIIIGGLVTLVGVGASLRSWRSLTAVTEQASDIHQSFAKLVSNLNGDKSIGSLTEADVEKMGVLRQARLTRQIRKTLKASIGEFKDLSAAFASVAAFPSVVLSAVAAITTMAVFGAIFMVMLLF